MDKASLDDATITELLKETLDEGRELVRVEVALARREALDELLAVKRAAVLLGAALVLATVAVALLGLALVLALGGGAAAAASAAGGMLLAALVTGVLGARALPTELLGGTQARVREDVRHIKEAIA